MTARSHQPARRRGISSAPASCSGPRLMVVRDARARSVRDLGQIDYGPSACTDSYARRLPSGAAAIVEAELVVRIPVGGGSSGRGAMSRAAADSRAPAPHPQACVESRPPAWWRRAVGVERQISRAASAAAKFFCAPTPPLFTMTRARASPADGVVRSRSTTRMSSAHLTDARQASMFALVEGDDRDVRGTRNSRPGPT